MSFCTYDTVKYVHIQDARLGCLRYILLLAVALYVVVFEMWAMGGYLATSSVVGVVRFSLQQPTVDNCDPSKPNCHNDMSPLNTLPYCTQYNHTTSAYVGTQYKCEIYEAMNAQIQSEKSIAVITRASTTNQTLVCGHEEVTCPRTYQDVSPEHKFYTAQSEAFTILLDHAVSASKICTFSSSSTSVKKNYACSAQASNYQGRLYSKHAEQCREQFEKGNAFASYRGNKETDAAPCFIRPNQTTTHQDFFSLDVLLKAAGANLDDCNDNNVVPTSSNEQEGFVERTLNSNTTTTTCQTYRETGATVLVNIYWSDLSPYHGRVEPFYYYDVQLVVGSSFKQSLPFYDSYRNSRTLLKAHGIKLSVLLGGEFHQFDFLTFLITLTTGLGLLAVVTCIMDNLMLYILPERKLYQQAKYETSQEIAFTPNQGNRILTSAIMGNLNPFSTTNSQEEDSNNDHVDSAIGEQQGQLGLAQEEKDEFQETNQGLDEPLL